MIDLYTSSTPNGWKISVMLEELGLDYTVHPIDLGAGEQKKPEYLVLNPNGKIPTIIDRAAGGLAIFESNAILLYLAEKTGSLMPLNIENRWSVMQWLFFQSSNVGPMVGQATVFYRYFPDKIIPAIERFRNEGRRLFEVLDTRLGESEWLADDYSIADIANWCWVRCHEWSGISIDGLENLHRWIMVMNERPACVKGITVPEISFLDNPNRNDEEVMDIANNIVQK